MVAYRAFAVLLGAASLLTCFGCLPVAGVDAAGKEAARLRINQLCSSTKEYPFLSCKTRRVKANSKKRSSNSGTGSTDLEWDTRSGTFGRGVVAYITNDPARYKNTYIYANAVIPSTDPSLQRIVLDVSKGKKVDPVRFPLIKVFIKTGNLGSMDRFSIYLSPTAFSFFELERQRSRALTRSRLAPAVLDVIDSRGSPPLLRFFIISQFLDGEDHSRISNLIANDLRDVWRQTLGSMQQIMMAPYSSRSAQRAASLRELVRALKQESYIRLRAYVATLATMLSTARRLWSLQYRHCDLHPGNFFALQQEVDVNSPTLEHLIVSGRALGPLELLGAPLRDVVAVRRLLQESGHKVATFYLLYPSGTRMLDFSFLTNLRPKITEAKLRGKALLSPCRTYSANRYEDSIEMKRAFVAFVEDFIDLEKFWHVQRSQSAVSTLSQSAEYGPVVQELDGVMKEILSFPASFVKDVIYRNPHWMSCVKSHDEYQVILAAALRKGFQASEKLRRTHVTKALCSVDIESEALLYALDRMQVWANSRILVNLPPSYLSAVTSSHGIETIPEPSWLI